MGVWDRMRAVSETGFFNHRRRNGESNGWALENRLTRTILDSSGSNCTANTVHTYTLEPLCPFLRSWQRESQSSPRTSGTCPRFLWPFV